MLFQQGTQVGTDLLLVLQLMFRCVQGLCLDGILMTRLLYFLVSAGEVCLHRMGRLA